MKKLLLSLGTIAAAAAPVATVIACGNNKDEATNALAKTLQTTKTSDIALVNTSTMSDDEKAAAITKIKAAKDFDSLTKIYNGLNVVQKNTTTNNDNATTTTDALVNMLEATKETDIKNIKNSTMSDDEQTKAIAQIKAAKDFDSLTKIYNGLNVEAKQSPTKPSGQSIGQQGSGQPAAQPSSQSTGQQSSEQSAAQPSGSYAQTKAVLPKENTEQFDGKDITWASTIDATKIKAGDVFEIDWNGVKQIVGVVSGQWKSVTPDISSDKMQFDASAQGITLKTIDGSYMEPGVIGVVAIDATHIASTEHENPALVLMRHVPAIKNGHSIEISRMGSVK